MAMQSVGNPAAQTGKPGRRYDIDWLRVLGVWLLIPFHTALIFGSGTSDHWIKDHPVPAADMFAHFVHQWHMPLLFLLAGSATWFALSRRTGGQYAKERFQRLLIPVLLVEIPIFYPFQSYFWFLDNVEGFNLPFYQHYVRMFTPELLGAFGVASVWGHLWFLVYLFCISMIALPLFLYLRKNEAGQRLISGLMAFFEKPGAIFLFAIPLSLVEVALRARWGNTRNLYGDWANFVSYLVIVIYGFLLVSDERIVRAIERHRWVALGLGIVSSALSFAWLLSSPYNEYWQHNTYSLGWVGYATLRGFNTWFWLIAILGFGKKYLNVGSKALNYFNEAALAYYILHMPADVVVGYFVMQWNISVLAKFIIITLGAFAVVMITYEVLVRRIGVIRFMFGMRSKKKVAPQAVQEQPA
jgi:glucan biosynthesis protein C